MGIILPTEVYSVYANQTYSTNDFKEAVSCAENSTYNEKYDVNRDSRIDARDYHAIGIGIATNAEIIDLMEHFFDDNVTGVNEQIGNSKQGRYGDCWLLSLFNCLRETQQGQQVIDDAITSDGDKYYVNFKATDTTIEVTKEELEKSNYQGYSIGDDDVALLEIAFNKLIKMISKKEVKPKKYYDELKKKKDITGGNTPVAYYLLTGKEMQVKKNYRNIPESFFYRPLALFAANSTEEVLDKIAQETKENKGRNISAVMNFSSIFKEGEGPFTVTDDKGNQIILAGKNSVLGNHTFSIQSADDLTVTLVNPWDSSASFTIPRYYAAQYSQSIEYIEFEEGEKE